MKTIQFPILLTVCMGLLLAQPELSIQITPEKLSKTPQEQESGELTFSPGDTLRYTISAANIGDALMTEAAVVDPLPEGVAYIAETASFDDADVTFSIDGSRFQEWPPTKIKLDENGNPVEIPAEAKDVTHIRWQILSDLEPGESREYTFLAVIK